MLLLRSYARSCCRLNNQLDVNSEGSDWRGFGERCGLHQSIGLMSFRGKSRDFGKGTLLLPCRRGHFYCFLTRRNTPRCEVIGVELESGQLLDSRQEGKMEVSGAVGSRGGFDGAQENRATRACGGFYSSIG